MVDSTPGHPIDRLRACLPRLNVQLEPQQARRFELYLELLVAWNQRLNLTAVRDPAQIQVRHFYDALTCIQVTGDLGDRRLIDVGTGAGFPGLPLKILYPGLRLTLLDSVAKKARFLHAVVEELGLDGVEIVAERAEAAGRSPDHRERYDWAVARAVAALPVLVEYLLPFCRPGGAMLAQKGPGVHKELVAAGVAARLLGGGAPKLTPVTLPDMAATYYLVHIAKESPTPDRYPRRVGVPSRRPLAA